MLAQLTEKIALLSKKQQKKLLAMVNAFVKENEAKALPARPYYDANKLDYTEKDIKNIIAKFPKDKQWTWADLENPLYFPTLVKFKVELLDYKIYIMKPKPIHQEILTQLTIYMGMYVVPHQLGKLYVAPLGVHIEEGTTLEPDIVFISVERKHIVTEKGVQEAPELVVEVISRANYKKLREEKKAKYAAFGVQEYWEIHPKSQKVLVEVLTQDEAGKPIYTLFSKAAKAGKVKSQVLKGFELEIEKIFPAIA